MKVSIHCLINLNKEQYLLRENRLQIQQEDKKKENNQKNMIIIVPVIITQIHKKVSTTLFQGQVQKLHH